MPTMTNKRPPTKAQFIRWLNDNPPTDHPLYLGYMRASSLVGRNPSLRGKCFGEHLYAHHKPEFYVLWSELMEAPDRWDSIKDGR